MTPAEQQLATQLTESLSLRLSGDELARLAQLVRRTRFVRLRTLYAATMRRAATPVERVVSRIELRQWVQRNVAEWQVYAATERIAALADELSESCEADSDDFDRIVARVVNEVTRDELRLMTGIEDPRDPIAMACCDTMCEALNLVDRGE